MTQPINVPGADKEVHIINDVGSAVLEELVAQLNASELVVTKTLTATSGSTARAMLGRWRYNAWIKSISVTNPQTDDFTAATTDIFVRYVAPTNADLVGTPVSPTDLFALEGFDAGTFAGPNALWDHQFIDGTNVTAKTGGGLKSVPADQVLYAEFVNNEGGQRSIEVTITYAPIDKLAMDPTPDYHRRSRGRNRKNRTD